MQIIKDPINFIYVVLYAVFFSAFAISFIPHGLHYNLSQIFEMALVRANKKRTNILLVALFLYGRYAKRSCFTLIICAVLCVRASKRMTQKRIHGFGACGNRFIVNEMQKKRKIQLKHWVNYKFSTATNCSSTTW